MPTKKELLDKCKELQIKGISNKSKVELEKLLETSGNLIQKETFDKNEKIHRLNYIGSKYQLLDWLESQILEKTDLKSFENVKIADLFSGTGIVSYFFTNKNANVISNDAELYSSIITEAYSICYYSKEVQDHIDSLNKKLDENLYKETFGFITKKYSPYDGNERMFFTVDNAQRIDYLRLQIENLKDSVDRKIYIFLLACLILGADSVSNVPAVYGCYLKKFKSKAEKSITLKPLHKNNIRISESRVYNSDVLDETFLSSFESDIVYLDPPYNERQYSKNYFPLNILAKTPESLLTEAPLKGKTGIPTDCFISPFCRKGQQVEKAFDLLFKELKTKWIFLSYNSESIVSKERMLELMKKYGETSVIERSYKRFKSFEYNKDVDIQEYLFCLKKD
jgi:adenine-specific DNA-methyltransferase